MSKSICSGFLYIACTFLFQDYQSAFAIDYTSSTYNSSTGVLIFQSTRTNIGNHYDTTTGQFTAQYAGIYVFILNLYTGSTADGMSCDIRKNGSGVAYAEVPAESEFGLYQSSGSTVLHLDPGDTVDVGDCYNPSGISDWTSFNGFLLQAD